MTLLEKLQQDLITWCRHGVIEIIGESTYRDLKFTR